MRSQSTTIAAVVYNPTKVERQDLESAVVGAAHDAGYSEVLWFETTAEDAGAGQTREALAAGASLVMAAGGDGTVRLVAHVLRGTTVPLALLPVGTGNVLAYNLGMPKMTVDDAAQIAFTGRRRSIDVGEMILEDDSGKTTQHTYLIVAGLGLDAAAMEQTSAKAKAKVGILAYVGGGMRAFASSKRVDIRVRVDDRKPFSTRVHSVMVANCGEYPPFFVLHPYASLDDGILDILCAGPLTFFGWLRLWINVVIDNRIILKQRSSRRGVSWKTWHSSAFEFVRGRSVTIRPENPMLCQVDGDSLGFARRIRCWVDAHSLVVMVACAAEEATSVDATHERPGAETSETSQVAES